MRAFMGAVKSEGLLRMCRIQSRRIRPQRSPRYLLRARVYRALTILRPIAPRLRHRAGMFSRPRSVALSSSDHFLFAQDVARLRGQPRRAAVDAQLTREFSDAGEGGGF